MDKYSFKEFIKSCSPFTFLFIGLFSGVVTTMAVNQSSIHTEKHGCEYVEKAECEQVWIKVRG